VLAVLEPQLLEMVLVDHLAQILFLVLLHQRVAVLAQGE
jgi:hypothetical protein